MSNEQKDFWDKLDIVLKPVGGLLTAAVVAILGLLTSSCVFRPIVTGDFGMIVTADFGGS